MADDRLAECRGGAACRTQQAAEDAVHISVATVHGMDYLLTWNCRHIANAEMRTRLVDSMLERGYLLPVICTPEELAGE